MSAKKQEKKNIFVLMQRKKSYKPTAKQKKKNRNIKNTCNYTRHNTTTKY